MKKRLIATFIIVGLTAMFMMPFTAMAMDKKLDAGSKWVVDQTISLDRLTVADGAVINSPEGYTVTMTVDGIETPIKPGDYKGKIVLTVAKEIKIIYRDKPFVLRTAVDIEDGKYAADKSVAAAASGGKITDTSAKDVKVTSIGENFNGFIVRGDTKSSYSIINPVIKLTGNGGSDFVGYGAAIMIDGNADVTINNALIVNHGVIRSAIVVRGNSIIHVNDSDIDINNGTLPEGITEPWNGGKGRIMMAVPWMLGLAGNCRATNIIGNGTAYYTNTHIKTQGWGALSTDATTKVRLNVTKCVVETMESGYGAYSIGDCIDTFSASTLNVHDMALIMTGTGSGVFTDGTVVNSKRFGVMMHGISGGTLTIDKGTVFNTKSAAIQVKSGGTTIIADNAKLNSESGVILQAIINDDPNMSGSGPGRSGGPGGADGTVNGSQGGRGQEGAAGAPGSGNNTINATFKNMTLKGDIVNGMTTLGEMTVNFEKTTITGAITTATTEAVGTPSYEQPYLIGEVKTTYCPTGDKYGIKVSLEKDSKWVADKTSYLTGLTISDGAVITALKGFKVTMTVDGIETAVKPGTYKGKIVLSVLKNN